MAKVYSFDVFDTALVRSVALPTDIFRIVAHALRPNSPGGLTDFVEEFVSARIVAERTARQKAAPREDCTIEEIWHELRLLLPDLPAHATAALEIQAEHDSITANPMLVPHIKALRDAGHRVIFISDIYYSRQTIFDLLSNAGLATALDQVYASSDAGLLKATGKLFPYVAKAEGISPHDLIHFGDNPVSDGSAARANGVQATVYNASRLNGAEQAVLNAFGDDLAGSRLAAAMRLARLTSHPDGQGSLVSAFLGPLAILQAAWALQQAAQGDAKRLYFVARDGHIPWRAAMEIADAFPEVESRYVKLSRHSLIAAIPRLDRFGVFWIKRSWAELTVSEIAELIGHDWVDVEHPLGLALPHAARDYLLRDTDEMSKFVGVLDDIEDNAEKIRRRDAALAYLREQGLLDNAPFMIFDVGWYLNLQAALKAVLEQQGVRGFAGGLYLGLSTGRVTEPIAGPARGLVYQQPHAPDTPEDSNILFDRRILVEHLMGLAPHGSAKGYVPGDEPTVIEGPITAERKVIVGKISDEVAAFAKLVAPFARKMGHEATARRAVEALARHFFRHPDRYDLTQLGALEVESDSGSNNRMSITEPWNLRALLLQCVPYRVRSRLALNHGPTLWPEASLARSGAISRKTLSMLGKTRRTVARIVRKTR